MLSIISICDYKLVCQVSHFQHDYNFVKNPWPPWETCMTLVGPDWRLRELGHSHGGFFSRLGIVLSQSICRILGIYIQTYRYLLLKLVVAAKHNVLLPCFFMCFNGLTLSRYSLVAVQPGSRDNLLFSWANRRLIQCTLDMPLPEVWSQRAKSSDACPTMDAEPVSSICFPTTESSRSLI